MSQELEAGIGGLYSILTQELQLPLVRRLLHVLRKQRKLQAFPKGQGGVPLVNPRPVTGLEAIGRGDDRNKLIQFITTATQTLGPEAVAKFVNIDEALRRLAASESIDTTNLVKSQDQLQQEAAAAQAEQQQAAQREMLMTGLKSSAMAQVANNYTQEGAPYGPQFADGTDPAQPGTQPNALPTPPGGPGIPSGPTGAGAAMGPNA